MQLAPVPEMSIPTPKNPYPSFQDPFNEEYTFTSNKDYLKNLSVMEGIFLDSKVLKVPGSPGHNANQKGNLETSQSRFPSNP